MYIVLSLCHACYFVYVVYLVKLVKCFAIRYFYSGEKREIKILLKTYKDV